VTLSAEEKKSTSTSTAATTTPDTVVLSFDSHNYTAREFERLVTAVAPPGTPITNEVKQRVAGTTVEMRLLADEALRRGLDKDPRVQVTLEIAREHALGQAVAYQLSERIFEREARNYYDQNKEGFEQVHVRHILIRTPESAAPPAAGKPELTESQAQAKAEEIRAKLLKGAVDFAKVAAAESYDLSASRGGEIPPFRRVSMPPEFENAAFALKPGEISLPVKTIFGYHIIQLLDRGPAPFDTVKTEIARHLERPALDKFLEQMKQAHPATLNDAYFGPEVDPNSAPQPSYMTPRR
jgi:parvulin-like peptidyl-prolyl isomerase